MSTTTPRPAGETTLAASLQAEVAFAAPAIGAAAEAAAASATVERAVLADDILERGDSGAVVRDLQSRLGVLGYGYGSLLGIFLLGVLTKSRGNDIANVFSMLLGIAAVLILGKVK
jgi:peptidoglycan hydrolase-like protein with peptidoglycan-binding domain